VQRNSERFGKSGIGPDFTSARLPFDVKSSPMSKDKKSKGWAMWVEKTSNALVNNPEIYRLLPPLILDLAVREDMTGPLCRGVVRNDYLNRLVDRLREPVARAIRDAGVSVSTERLTEICQCAAGETFVIRTLN